MKVLGHLIVISTHFYNNCKRIVLVLKGKIYHYLENTRHCLTTFPNTSKFVKNSGHTSYFHISSRAVFENVVEK